VLGVGVLQQAVQSTEEALTLGREHLVPLHGAHLERGPYREGERTGVPARQSEPQHGRHEHGQVLPTEHSTGRGGVGP